MAQQTLSLANLQAALTQNNTKMKEWVNSQIGDIDLFSIQWVQELPTEDISTSTIYMIKNEEAEEGLNIYTEYVYNATLEAWEVLGELHAEVDLSGYYDKEEIDNLIKSYYTKTEVDEALGGYYTKEEVETQVSEALKAHYTKEEIDEQLEALEVSGYEESEVTSMVNELWS
jgi:hypothetical protein